MSKSRVDLDEKTYFRDIHFLYKIINSLKDIEETKLLLKDLLTKSELRMLKRRWHIANLIDQGYDMRTIAVKVHSSTQTVARVKRALDDGYGGLRIAIERVNKAVQKEKEEYVKSKKTYGGSKFMKDKLKLK